MLWTVSVHMKEVQVLWPNGYQAQDGEVAGSNPGSGSDLLPHPHPPLLIVSRWWKTFIQGHECVSNLTTF